MATDIFAELDTALARIQQHSHTPHDGGLIADSTPDPRVVGAADTAGSRLVVRALTEVETQAAEWDWHRWVPRGKLVLLGGYAGDGKSTLLAALAASASNQGDWPDDTPCPRPIRTLFVLGEDAAGDTLKPRLELHDADMSRIFVIETVLDAQGRDRVFNVAKHLDLLEAEIIAHQIDWLVIDPLTTVMSGTDRNAEGDTRDTLTPLIKLAERQQVTIFGVTHIGKSEGSRRAAQKILGATAFHAMARVVWMIAPDEQERMVLGVVKSNLAMKPPSLVWSREEDGPIQWEGVSAQDVEELLAAPTLSSPRTDAEGFLRESLKGGAKPTKQVEETAKAQGISLATLRRAADAIPVKKWKAPGAYGQWHWGLPDGSPAPSAPANGGAESNLLTPKESQVSKLSKFHEPNLLNDDRSEHLHATTPIFTNGHANGHTHIMEGAQLAHPLPLRSEQVTSPTDVVDLAKHIATLSESELQAYREEIATALDSDPHLDLDRKALALVDVMRQKNAAL